MRAEYLVITAMGVVIACAAAGLAILNDDGDDSHEMETHTIEYELDGGENHPSNPKSYSYSRKEAELLLFYGAQREGYDFDGWYADPDFEEPLPDFLRGDVRLYAKWSPVLTGCAYTLALSGTLSVGPYGTTTAAGTVEISYVDFDPEADGWYGAYLIHRKEHFDLEPADTSNLEYYEWEDAVSDLYSITSSSVQRGVTYDGHMCDLYVVSRDSGMTVTEYVDAEKTWLPRHIVQEREVTGTRLEGGCVSFTETKSWAGVSVTVRSESGVETGADALSHTPGGNVRLHAEGDSFAGWYDHCMNLLSRERDFKCRLSGREATFLALASDPDYTTYSVGVCTMKAEVPLGPDASWTVTSYAEGGGTTALTGVAPQFHFRSSGVYFVEASDGAGASFQKAYFVDSTGIRTYEWDFGGESWSTSLGIRFSDYYHFKTFRGGDYRGNPENVAATVSYVVTESERDDAYIAQLAEFFRSVADRRAWDDYTLADFALRFVQFGIPYLADDSQYGASEYWAYPLETLYNGRGDCEDTSFLYAAIMRELGFKTVLYGMPSHLAAGVHANEVSGRNHCTTEDGVGFYYAETTYAPPSGEDGRSLGLLWAHPSHYLDKQNENPELRVFIAYKVPPRTGQPRSVFEAVDRGGDSPAAIDEVGAAEPAHGHYLRAAKQSTELDFVACLLTDYGDEPDCGGLVVDHADRHLVGDYAGDGGRGRVTRNRDHVQPHGADAGHGLELLYGQRTDVRGLRHGGVLGDGDECARQPTDVR